MNGFTVIHEELMDEFNLKGTLLVHDRTGMKIFYAVPKKDKNLYFSYCIKTPAVDNSGTTHVLEHCILNGSQKFPVHDLISHMEARSTASFNANTGSRTTSFYADTFVEKEYFNLLDLMGDAVFFPLLKRETFLNEGMRLELDENGKPKMTGVVFNEVNNDQHILQLPFYDELKDMFEGCIEQNVSGGDPRFIHEMSYEKMLDYHKKYYVPANALLVLCGSIPLEKQLEFLEEKLLSRLPSGTSEYTYEDGTVLKKGWKNRVYRVPFFGNEESIDFRIGFFQKDSCECKKERTRDVLFDIIGAYLDDHIADPEYGKYLRLAKIGSSKHSVFFFYLEDVRLKEIKKAKKYILEIINDLYNNASFAETAIDYADKVDFVNKNKFDEAQFSEFADMVMSGWVERNNPFYYVSDRETQWEELKKILLSSEFDSIMKAFIKETFLDCKHIFSAYGLQDKKFFDRVLKLQEKNARKLLKKTTVEQVMKDSEIAKQYKQEDSAAAAKKYLPTLELSDLPEWEFYEKASLESIEGKNGPIHFFFSEQEIKNQTYFEIRFAIDNLSKEELWDVNKAIGLIEYIGFGNYDRISCSDAVNRLGIRGISREMITNDCVTYCEEKNPYENRYWLKVSFNVVNENLENALQMMKEYIFNPNKKDKVMIDKFLENTVKARDEDTFEEGVPSAYTSLMQYYSRFDYDVNQMFGFNSHALLKKYADMKPEDLLEYLFGLYDKIIHGEAIVYTFSAKEAAPTSRKIISDFVKTLDIHTLKERKLNNPDSSEEVISKKNLNEKYLCSVVNPQENGALLMFMKGSSYPSKEYTAENALFAWFEDGQLYDIARKQNGAYSYSCGNSIQNAVIQIRTERDPNPKKNMECIEKALEELTTFEFTEDLVKEIILKIYGEGLGNIHAIGKGDLAISHALKGSGRKYREKRFQDILSLTPEDLHNAAVRIYEASKTARICTVTRDKSQVIGEVIWDCEKMAAKNRG